MLDRKNSRGRTRHEILAPLPDPDDVQPSPAPGTPVKIA
jgi:hypothetical protein